MSAASFEDLIQHVGHHVVVDLILSYNFNDSYCTLTLTGDQVQRAFDAGWLKDNPPLYRAHQVKNEVGWYHLNYERGNEIKGFFYLFTKLVG